jgi:LmbE family N-acetylglucosaminyl deacetylase
MVEIQEGNMSTPTIKSADRAELSAQVVPARALTLMAVHAHPDDEASTTGGILAKYSAEGATTVVVTCTNGELGDGPGGVKPGERGHDEAGVVAQRRRELEESCGILGVSHLELLGYRDSGMMGWPTNDAPGAFWGVPDEVAAKPLAGLMDRYRPQVVVTYDDYGFYGHPDHIKAHRITLAALDATGLPVKLYCPTIRKSRLAEFGRRMAQAGVEVPEVDDSRFGSLDGDVAATIDCRQHAGAKRAALAAHASQSDNMFFLGFSLPDFTELFGTEEFIRLRDSAGSPTPEDDLFTGL